MGSPQLVPVHLSINNVHNETFLACAFQKCPSFATVLVFAQQQEPKCVWEVLIPRTWYSACDSMCDC